MVSNLTTTLQILFYQMPNDKLLALVCCRYSCCQCGLHFPLSLEDFCLHNGAPWVGSNVEMWSCLSGYRPSYFVLEGGKGVGRSTRESQAPLLCRSTPRALAKDWWSVRAESCLPDPSDMPCQGSKHTLTVLVMHTCISSSFDYG